MEEQLSPVMAKISEILLFLEKWLQTNVLTWRTAAQWLCALGALLIALAVWRVIRPRLERWRYVHVRNPLGRGALYVVIQTGGLVLFILLAQMAAGAFELLEYRPWVLDALSQLTVAGIAIRLLALTMPNKGLARSTSTVVWVFVGLHILGLLTPFTTFLQNLSFSMGDTRFTALGALKGLILAVIFLQAAVMLSRFAVSRIGNMRDVSPSVQVLLGKTVKVALFTIAILMAMSSVGIDLTSLAIFSSALGVGIGFGLQTIISNYVAGIILLMDRSIKPGDTIEVGGVFGVVSGVYGRFSSVKTRDGKEYLIPNEHFVTNEVINWTYSDTNIRLKIPVGVAYESDVNKALRLMEEAPKGMKRILTSPEPRAMLIEFGDSSVNLELRAWIADTNDGVTNIKSDVLKRIWDLFHENGIAFPFPQRDVLLKPGSALAVTVDRGDAQKGGDTHDEPADIAPDESKG
ncbi:Mechanosensitive channel MscK precursor [Pseudodesulfovibrio hydrargyri]|uniref:Mechanosensitive channel MscK n=1 Tax=Pseudodesulfovibrio hydrargyri TaxID=2125990 RepID=A0A1J5MU10_9BACT|nr:mechanosensitive ion channel domain-containing protein [Pseudodesulfovibrio hydrargyri]OIQ50118.1 Mechanosensitive channel MscK precursor [Pseudodesulfovibrio hydrargyri]